MIKKLLILFIIFFLVGFGSVYGSTDNLSDEDFNKIEKEFNNLTTEDERMDSEFDKIEKEFNNLTTEDERMDSEFDKIEKEFNDLDRDVECKESKGCIEKSSFIINVDDISPGMKVNGKSTIDNVNFALGTIIQTLMIALGSLSLLIMTIGAGYIVLHHGQDELLSKGKSIFMSGVYALIVALSSYYLVAIVRYVLFQ